MRVKFCRSFRDSEIRELGHHVFIQEDVAGFHIPVNNRWILHNGGAVRRASPKQIAAPWEVPRDSNFMCTKSKITANACKYSRP